MGVSEFVGMFVGCVLCVWVGLWDMRVVCLCVCGERYVCGLCLEQRVCLWLYGLCVCLWAICVCVCVCGCVCRCGREGDGIY